MNLTPTDKEHMDPIQFHTHCFLHNWELRNTSDKYWYRLHRIWAKDNIAQLRFLKNKQRKKFGPTHYGLVVPS